MLSGNSIPMSPSTVSTASLRGLVPQNRSEVSKVKTLPSSHSKITTTQSSLCNNSRAATAVYFSKWNWPIRSRTISRTWIVWWMKQIACHAKTRPSRCRLRPNSKISECFPPPLPPPSGPNIDLFPFEAHPTHWEREIRFEYPLSHWIVSSRRHPTFFSLLFFCLKEKVYKYCTEGWSIKAKRNCQ